MLRKLLVLVALALVAGATWLGVRAHSAASDLKDARAALEDAKSRLLARDLTRAEAALARAKRDTRAARSITGGWSWQGASHVPLLGRSFSAVSDVADAADTVTSGALTDALDSARLLDPSRIRRADGSVDVSFLQRARLGLDQALQSTQAARSAARRSPDSLLLPFVADARTSFLDSSDHLTAGLETARRALDLAPALLGMDRPRRYFVAVQQNAESRGTGGLIGGFAVIEADRGRISVLQQGSNKDLYDDERPVDPPKDLPQGFTDAYGPYSVFSSWQNINLPPQVPAVASLIQAKWAKRTGTHLDAVVFLDGNALRELLLGGPPLHVAGKTIKPTDIADYLAVGQYEGVQLDEASRTRRKDDLQQIGADVLHRLTRSGANSGPLYSGLLRAVRSGHLRVASTDPTLSGLHELGIDGALPEGPAPVAYPVVFNSQGSKLDLWLHRKVSWSCASGGRTRITVELKSDLPTAQLPPYIGLDLRQNPKVVVTRTDAVHLDVYVTRGARLVSATLNGKPAPPSGLVHGVVDGLPFWGADVELPERKTQVFELLLTGGGHGGVRMPEQPLATPLTKEGSGGC